MLDNNMIIGILIVAITLFVGAITTMTYCVYKSVEALTSELGDKKHHIEPEVETNTEIHPANVGYDGNPEMSVDEESFVF